MESGALASLGVQSTRPSYRRPDSAVNDISTLGRFSDVLRLLGLWSPAKDSSSLNGALQKTTGKAAFRKSIQRMIPVMAICAGLHALEWVVWCSKYKNATKSNSPITGCPDNIFWFQFMTFGAALLVGLLVFNCFFVSFLQTSPGSSKGLAWCNAEASIVWDDSLSQARDQGPSGKFHDVIQGAATEKLLRYGQNGIKYLCWSLALLAPICFMYYFTFSKAQTVNGTSIDLGGIAVACAALHYFAFSVPLIYIQSILTLLGINIVCLSCRYKGKRHKNQLAI